MLFTYRGVSIQGSHVMRLVHRATIASTAFTPGDGVVAARFVTAKELQMLPLVSADTAFIEYLPIIWPLASGDH